MINRIKNIKTIFVKKFYSNLEKDFLEQKEQMEKEATYIQYKKNTKTLKQQNISQYQLLKLGVVDNKTLDGLKKNKNITLLTVEKLCKALNCTPNDIVTFK